MLVGSRSFLLASLLVTLVGAFRLPHAQQKEQKQYCQKLKLKSQFLVLLLGFVIGGVFCLCGLAETVKQKAAQKGNTPIVQFA